MAVGHRNRDIAAELVVSQHTVKFHVANIFEKLGVRTRAEVAAVAFAAGIHPRAAPAPATPPPPECPDGRRRRRPGPLPASGRASQAAEPRAGGRSGPPRRTRRTGRQGGDDRVEPPARGIRRQALPPQRRAARRPHPTSRRSSRSPGCSASRGRVCSGSRARRSSGCTVSSVRARSRRAGARRGGPAAAASPGAATPAGPRPRGLTATSRFLQPRAGQPRGRAAADVVDHRGGQLAADAAAGDEVDDRDDRVGHRVTSAGRGEPPRRAWRTRRAGARPRRRRRRSRSNGAACAYPPVCLRSLGDHPCRSVVVSSTVAGRRPSGVRPLADGIRRRTARPRPPRGRTRRRTPGSPRRSPGRSPRTRAGPPRAGAPSRRTSTRAPSRPR
jgi:hypothetical protein